MMKSTRHTCLLLFLLSLLSFGARGDNPESEVELTNFAFANYLGSGLYGSDDGRLFIYRHKLSSEIREATAYEPGWKINYPIAIGAGRIEDGGTGLPPDIEDLLDLNNFATLSVLPGLEYNYPVLPNWQLAPFVDYGFAHDLRNDTSVRVQGAGLKSWVVFDFDHAWLVLGNRLLYADQKNLDTGSTADFASFETALDYTIPTRFSLDGSVMHFSLYYINYYYPRDLEIQQQLSSQISLQNKNEVGFTFHVAQHDWLPQGFRIGLGYQSTRNTDLIRIVFGAPFF